MSNNTIPAGNHVIKAVQYDAPRNQTKLTLCCGQVAWLSMLQTTQYKPEAGDYYIVTDHGTASLIRASVFKGAVKSTIKRPPQYRIDHLFGLPLIDPKKVVAMEMGAGDDIARLFMFDPQDFKFTKLAEAASWPSPEDIRASMREENGYAEKPQTGNTLTTTDAVAKEFAEKYPDATCAKNPTEVAAVSASNMNHLLSNMDAQVWAKEFCSINKASDESAMLSWFACAIMTGFDEANRRNDKSIKALEEQLAKDQNTIKSLTAQNDKKQETINQQRKMFDRRQDLSKQLNKLIDICSERGLV